MNTGSEATTPLGPTVLSSARRRYQRRCSVTEASLRAAQKLLQESFCDDEVVDHVPVTPCRFIPVGVRLVGDSLTIDRSTFRAAAQRYLPTRVTNPSEVDEPAASNLLPAFPLLAPEVKDVNCSKTSPSQGISLGYQSYRPCIRLSSKRKIPELSLPMQESLPPSTQDALSGQGPSHPSKSNCKCKRVRIMDVQPSSDP